MKRSEMRGTPAAPKHKGAPAPAFKHERCMGCAAPGSAEKFSHKDHEDHKGHKEILCAIIALFVWIP
jgi:hypothetical protein